MFTSFSWITATALSLTLILEFERRRRRSPHDSVLAVTTSVGFIISSFVLVGEVATQAAQSTAPAALGFLAVLAAMATVLGLRGIVPAMVTSAQNTDRRGPSLDTH